MRTLSKAIPIVLLGLGVSCIPVFAAMPDVPDTANYGQEMPLPGTLNYVEGTAHLEGRLLNDRNLGSISMEPGQVLATQTGKAEILLTPGVFLRVNDHSAVRMISPDIVHTQVELVRGEAGVEVDQIHPQNDLEIVDGGFNTQLVKKGFYEFTAYPARVLVFSGQAEVEVRDGRYKKVKGSHEMAMTPGATPRAVKFNVDDAKDELYNWSKLRSQYEAEAYSQMEGEYGGWGGYYPGWYWDPYMMGFAYGGGPFWNPFGWGLYPWGGFYGGYYGFRGGGFYGGRAFGGGGFHGGGFGGGGFHGGGGRR